MISKNNYNFSWETVFYYDESSPSGLKWKVDIYSGRKQSILSIKSGSIAGTPQYRKNGTPSKWIVKYKGKNYSVSKIVYILINGYVDNNILIDHVDRNPFNNNISNLRAVSENINLKNKNFQINNSSGFTGVSIRTAGGVKYYTATWVNPITKKQEGKSFNSKKLGEFLAKIKAIVYRFHKIKSLSDYSDQHYNYLDLTEIALLEDVIVKMEASK